MSFPTFYDPELPGDAQVEYVLDGSEGRHAATVRRIRVGEIVDVVDGHGTRIRGEVTDTGRTDVTLAVHARTVEPSPAVRITLVQALGKGGRDESAIEAATEVGLDRVIAWESERSISQWRGEKQMKGLARWDSIVTSAMKQSRRCHKPDVRGYARGADLVELLPAGAQVLVLDEQASIPLTAVELPTEGEIVLVVGPEGGLTAEEITTLTDRPGATAVRLGREIVRTSTAGPVAVAVLNTRLGRW